MAEVQLTAEHNILANEQQHYEQSESIYDTYLLEKVDRNTTPDSTDMSQRGGEIDQNAVKCQVSCPLLNPSFDNMTTEFSKQFLESENISLKKTVAQLQKDFSRMEAHCVNMELKYQNQALKDGQHGQILNETSNKAKIKKEIELLETINIELEHSVAKLLIENDNKTVENADLKAQIQEKIFANVALKNELRKLKGNSVDIKFAKPSILGKPILQPPRNLLVVRQPNAFKSERPNFSKPRNSSKESYGLNDIAHNYYLEEAKKKTQDENMNLKPSVMHTTSLQNTTNGSKPQPRSNNQISRSLPVSKSSCGMSNGVPLVDQSRNSSSFLDSKHFVCSTCQKCVFNANHDACITKFLKEVNSHIKVQSPKTRNSNKPVEPKIHTQKPVPTGKIFTSSTTKVDCEPLNGSNEDITNPYECDQTLNVSAGLVSNPTPSTPYVPPSRTDWDLLFQPLFDELLNPSPSVDLSAPKVIAPISEVAALEPAASTGSPSSTTVNQDAPSPSNSQKTPETQSLVISNDVEEENHDLDVAHMNNDPFFGIPIPENDSEASSFFGFEPKNYKDALTQACWIEAMQEELNEFERGILKNKARLVARGYRQEEGIDFEESFALVARTDD
ncbi:hypothetical protein Tco_0732876 [Tanacetum coccineum]